MRTLTVLIAGWSCLGIRRPVAGLGRGRMRAMARASGLGSYPGQRFNLNLRTSQDKNQHLRGEATYWNETMSGSIDGHIRGDQLIFAIYWQNNAVGDYNGTIDRAGHVEGFTQDRNNKSATAGFHGRSLLNCAKWVQSSPPPEAPAQSSGPQSTPDAIMHKSHEEAGTPPAGGTGKVLPKPAASEAEKLGVTEKPGRGIGDTLEETTPPTPEERRGITERAGKGIGEILRETNP